MADSLFQKYVVRGVNPGAHVCILAGVHGDEWEPMAAVRSLIQELEERLVAGTVTLVPVLNESAFVRRTRTGEDGLDLARVFPGDAGGSLTRRLAAQCHELLSGVDFLVDLHTGGQAYQLIPLGGYMYHADAAVLQAQREIALAFGMPFVWGTPTATGRTLSSAAGFNVPAIYAEWGGGSPPDAAAVQGYFDGCLRVLKHLGLVSEAPETATVPVVVEEFQDVAVDLCGTHQAEWAGFFEPAVQLGQYVRRGQSLGTLWMVHNAGSKAVNVPAAQNGTVICLRAIPSVEHGDSLARLVEVQL